MSRLKTHADLPRVAILTSTIVKGLSEMLQGVLEYAREHGPWRIYQQEDRLWMPRLQDLKQWGCTGIIAAAHHSPEEAAVIAGVGVPVVVLLQPHAMRRRSYPLFRYPCVVWDSVAIGRMAAAYFVERHYEHFAFVGAVDPDTYWSRDRLRAYRTALREAGRPRCDVYRSCYEGDTADWAVERPHMETWLKELPRPIALFAPNDRRGRQVLDACLDAGIAVPDEVAVLGVDNDDWICEASVPTLSSIQCNPRPAGYAISAHLDRMMRGERLKKQEYAVEPMQVVTRQSTEWTAIDDQCVARALSFIRLNAANPRLNVPLVTRTIALSRRAAEIRFRQATGRTVREEIEHVRLERVRTLLAETDERMADIADQCGFGSATHLGRIFRQRFGITMRRFRAAARSRAGS
jgi:LacI family transcriptional regulator